MYGCCFGEVPGGIVHYDLSSADGASWSVRRRTEPAELLTGYAFGAGRFVALGGRAVFTSSDGTVWRQVREFSEHFNAISYLKGRFVLAGRTVLVSPDGEAWTVVDFPAP